MIDPTTAILANTTAYRARSYIDALSDLMVAIATKDQRATVRARERLNQVMLSTIGTAEVIGASAALRKAAAVHAQMGTARFRASHRELARFAALPEQTILPRVTFEEAVEDMVQRAPTTLKAAAERTAARISQLYSEGRVVAFVRSAEQAVTERVQSLITQAIREGISESISGNLISMGVDRIREETEAWTEGYSRMAFRTNVNTGVTAGRFRQVQDRDVAEVIPALRFDTVGDVDTRPNHQAADGIILRAGNPAWGQLASPLGYACRCSVSFASMPELDRMGRLDGNNQVIESRIPPDAGPDPGFRHGGRPDLFLEGDAGALVLA